MFRKHSNRMSTVVCLAMILLGCQNPPLTPDAAKIILEASPEFQPKRVSVRLTEEEIRKGTDAGYWYISGVKRSDAPLPISMILLTPLGATYFRGASPIHTPQMSILQELGARVVEVKKIEDDTAHRGNKLVEYTWSYRFENQAPEIAALFQDQPAATATKIFRYGKSGWELQP